MNRLSGPIPASWPGAMGRLGSGLRSVQLDFNPLMCGPIPPEWAPGAPAAVGFLNTNRTGLGGPCPSPLEEADDNNLRSTNTTPILRVTIVWPGGARGWHV